MPFTAARGCVTGLTSASLVVALSAPALAATSTPSSQNAPVPANASVLVVTGQGHGHGHGMSQYGAKVAAERGLGQRAILNFYYPGTGVGTARGTMRVLVSEQRRLTVTNQKALRLKVVGGRTYRLARIKPRAARSATLWRAVPQGARTTVQWKKAGRWHTWRTVRPEVEFSAGSRPVGWKSGGRTVNYRGALRLAVPAGKPRDRDIVNRVSMEQYVRGVVALEMPALWAKAAVQAQAVTARSYAAYERATTDRGHFDVYATVQSQVYGGASAETPQSDAAARATRAEVRTYSGSVAFTQFSASNGGWMLANSVVPYLRSGKDPYDPVRRWTVRIPMSQVAARFGSTHPLATVTVSRYPAAGTWVDTVTLTGTNGRTNTVRGETFRAWAGLPSSSFTLAAVQ